MFPVSITSGPSEIVSTGSVISYESHPVNMTISMPGFDLVIIFKFENDEGVDDPSSHPSVSDKGELVILLKNYKSELGAGITSPLQIGNYKSNPLFLNYRVYSLTEDSNRLIHYTVYQGKGELI